MKYNDYELEDFLVDTDFNDWAKGEGGEKAYFFNKWLDSDPKNKNVAYQAREILISLEHEALEPTQEEYDDVLLHVLQYKDNIQTRRKDFAPYWRWAAIIIVSVTASLVLFTQRDYWKKFRNQVTDANYVIKKNAKGQRSKISLPDGSIVFLNAESEIRYNNNFGKYSREIKLTGEAFFDVQKNEALPFVVMSGSVSTEALGTSFNIKSFDSSAIEVSLVTGQVKVSHEEKQIVLQPGEKLVTRHDAFAKEKFDPSDIGWKDGLIVFKSSSLSEVISTLERWYDVKFIIVNKPGDRWQYTGRFANTSLQQVMERMAYIENFEFTIDGNIVELKFNH
jgi:transmembrane sensor